MKTLFVFLCTLFLFFVQAKGQTIAKTSRIKIYATLAELTKIQDAGIEFDHGYYDNETSTYINTFDAAVVQQIRDLGFTVDVLVNDVVAYTDSINRVQSATVYSNEPVKNQPTLQALALNFEAPCQSYDTYITTPSTFSLGSMGGFYNLAELEAQIDNMVATYPNLVSKSSIGNTLQGRPIWVVKISDNVATDENEPEVLYTGMNHAREGMSMMNLIFFMRYLLENYTTNPKIKEIIDNRELFFIPVVNIDGFNFNTTTANWSAGVRYRRKNMQETTTTATNADGSGGDGVDINRNYGTYWGPSYENSVSGQLGSSGTGSNDAYRGVSAFSEPETQHVRDFVDSRFFKVALNYHCYGNWWIRASGPDDVTYPAVALSATNISIYNSIAALFTKQNCYVYGTPKQTVYPVNGYSDDYLFTGSPKAPIFAFSSPEIGSSTDDFWAPQARIIPMAKELVFPNLQAAYTAGSYAELQDNSDIAVASTTGRLILQLHARA